MAETCCIECNKRIFAHKCSLVPLEFFIDIKSFRSRYGPGFDSASNRNEYQEHFLGGKGGRCVRLTTLPPSCAVVMKSGNLNFLEPSGPLQACNGTALMCSSSCEHRLCGTAGICQLKCISSCVAWIRLFNVTGENYIMRILMVCTAHQILFG